MSYLCFKDNLRFSKCNFKIVVTSHSWTSVNTVVKHVVKISAFELRNSSIYKSTDNIRRKLSLSFLKKPAFILQKPLFSGKYFYISLNYLKISRSRTLRVKIPPQIYPLEGNFLWYPGCQIPRNLEPCDTPLGFTE